MRRDEALRFVGLVVGATGSKDDWSDETIEVYVNEVASWQDPEAATEAVAQLIQSWTWGHKPAVGVLHQAYMAACRRHELMAPRELPPPGCPFERGVGICWEAYVQECRMPTVQGWDPREPNRDYFDSMLGAALTKARSRTRGPILTEWAGPGTPAVEMMA